MKTPVAIPFMVIFLAVGLGIGFKTALIREHNQLERNKELLRRVHKEVWSNPDLNAAMKAADELYTPDFVLHDWTGDSYGVNNVKKGVTETRASFPDSREEVLDIVAERNMVMTRFVSTGTQKGDIPAIPGYQPVVPPNGKFQQFPELAVHRLVNGKIAEQWDFTDSWGANIQAGLIDPSNWSASAVCRPDAGVSDPRFKSSNSRSQPEPATRQLPAQSDKTLLDLIMANEYKIVATLQRNDIDAFASMLPEDIVDIEDDGIHAKADWVKEIQKQKKDGYLFIDFKFEDPRLIRLGPDAAIMFGKETWHATDKGKPVEARLYTHALYVRRAGTWVPRFYQDTIAQNSN
jgi:predicted ester cyclase